MDVNVKGGYSNQTIKMPSTKSKGRKGANRPKAYSMKEEPHTKGKAGKRGSRDATSLGAMMRAQQDHAKRLEAYSGVERPLVVKLIQYANLLAKPGTSIIEKNVFFAQMLYRFSMTSTLNLELMYEGVLKNATQPRQGGIDVDDFIRMLCLFLSPNLDLKIDFVFKSYDVDCDLSLSLAELRLLLRGTITSVDSDDTGLGDDSAGGLGEDPLKEIIDIVMGLVDQNNDGTITPAEFRDFVKKNILFIELFGQVLPNDTQLHAFKKILQTLTDTEINKYFKEERMRCLNELPIPTTKKQQATAQDYYPFPLEYDII